MHSEKSVNIPQSYSCYTFQVFEAPLIVATDISLHVQCFLGNKGIYKKFCISIQYAKV